MAKNPFSGLTASLASRKEAGRQSNSYAGQSQQHALRQAAERRLGSPREMDRQAASYAGRGQQSYDDQIGRMKAEQDRQAGSYESMSGKMDLRNLGVGLNPESPNTPSGMGGPVGPSLADLAKQAMNDKYAAVEGRINSSSEANQSAFAEAQAKMAEFYGKAAEDRKEPYAKGVTELAGNLANLGMDFTSGDLAKDWDKNERNLQENADLALANDQTWFEKMKTVNKDVYSQLMVELAQAKLAEELAMASGGSGGGGGRGRGGGGSSKSGTGGTLSGDIQADTNFEDILPGVREGLALLGPTDAARRGLQYDQYGDPDAVLAQLAERAALEGKYMNRTSRPARVSVNPVATANSVLQRLLPTAATISNRRTNSDRNWWQGQSSRYGPIQTNSKINETSKNTRNKQTYS